MFPHINSFISLVESVSSLKIAKAEAVKAWGHDPKAGSLELAIYSVNASWSCGACSTSKLGVHFPALLIHEDSARSTMAS